MNLDELISFWEDLATAPTLSKRNKMVLKRTIEELQGKKHLLQKISDEMLPGKKFCCRYGHLVVKGKAHKWPEEKPNELGYYLVRMRSGIMAVLPYSEGSFYVDDYMLLNYTDMSNPITHWWHLPEVTE